MKIIVPSIFLLALSGCATSTGVVPMGKDTYMIAIGGKTTASGGKLKAQALKEAAEYCSQKNKQLQVVNTQQRDMSFGIDPSAEIQFMCLDSSDVEFQRPKMQKAPDNVIEIRK